MNQTDKAVLDEKQKIEDGIIIKDFVKIAKKEGIDKALKKTQAKIKSNNQIVNLSYTIPCFQHEGAYAIFKGVEKVVGQFDLTATGGMSGDRNPQLISIILPNGEEVKVPWGNIALPTFDENSSINMDYRWDKAEIHVRAEVAKRFEDQIKKIVDATNVVLGTPGEGLYTGQAIELEFDEDGDVQEPKFLDLTKIDSGKILFSSDINDGLVPILARITQTAACVEQNLDVKLGVLMEGPYGTGKTLTAFHIAKVAIANGWTFIYLKDCNHVAKALKIAENYARKGNGVIVFTEDIDQALRGDRNKSIQDIVNTLDGGDTKNLPIISIFTTNHIELIEPTFLRGKRIGSLINFGALDRDTAQQFIEKLVVNAKGEPLMEAGNKDEAVEALCGIVPAFASEVIDKAKAYMINRGGSKISNDDIVKASESYRKQMKFAELKKHEPKGRVEDAIKLVYDAIAEKPTDKKLLNKIASKFGVSTSNDD